jgi:hypothetical protein
LRIGTRISGREPVTYIFSLFGSGAMDASSTLASALEKLVFLV